MSTEKKQQNSMEKFRNFTNPKEFEKQKKDQFLKLEQGDNKIRVLTFPIEFYEFFLPNELGKSMPHRCLLDRSKQNPYENMMKSMYIPMVEESKKTNEKIKSVQDYIEFKKQFSDWKSEDFKIQTKNYESENIVIQVKACISMVVYDYKTQTIKAAIFNQTGITDVIYSFLNEKDYQVLSGFDIKITKTGEKLNTKYSVLALKHSDIIDLKDEEIEIVKLFHENPCDLKKLLIGEYPFDNVENPEDLFLD